MLHALCAFLLLHLSPTFWHDLLAQTAFRTVAVAGSVTAIIKGVRKVYPNLSGPWALLANLLLSICGILAGMPPANILSETTAVQLGLVIAAAGGFHNIWETIKDLFPNKAATDPSALPTSKGNTLPIAALAMLLPLFMLTGCIHSAGTTVPVPPAVGSVDSIDSTANQTLQTIQAFMGPVIRDIGNGKLTASPAQRQAIDTLDAAYNGAVIAENAYRACVKAGSASTVCLTSSALTGAVAGASTAFTAAQTSLASSAH